jgi:hypothetical protein
MDNFYELLWLVDCQQSIARQIRIASILGRREEAIQLAWSWKFIDMRIKALA